MKYLLLPCLFLTGCFSIEPHDGLDPSEVRHRAAVTESSCVAGVLFTVKEFVPLIRGKVKEGQLDHIWDKCRALSRGE